MDLKLNGKKVIIVGGTRGIGRSITEHFAKEKCDIAICARTDQDICETVSSIQHQNIKIIGHKVDIANTQNFTQWINDAANALNGVDIYISTVSAQSYRWDKSVEIDLLACVQGIETVIPYLKKSQSGAIVSISSKAAMLNVPSYKPYSAVKAAVISYMSSLSHELAPFGIRVNTVSPGEIYCKGGFWERIEQEDPSLFKKTLDKNITGRFGKPDEVAQAVLFLSSSAASYISGTNLLVDGGSREHVQF